MNISRSLAAINAAGLLALAVPAGPAHAAAVQPRASGTFTYYDYSGTRQTLTNPLSNQCIAINGANDSGPVSNQTGSMAVMYTAPDCSGLGFLIGQGQTKDLPGYASFYAVLFSD